MLPLSSLWAIEPEAFNAFIVQARSILASPSLMTAGPVDDAARNGLPVQVIGDAAVVPMRGITMKRPNFFSRLLGWTTMQEVQASVAAAAADPQIKTIVLAIDSPGGPIDGIAELADEIYRARQSKPVIVQVDGTMASAAFWIGSQGTTINAGRGDLVGSIGVRMAMYDYSKLFENDGIEPVIIDTGAFKSAGATGTKITDEQRADFQRLVDAQFSDFLAAISRGRPSLIGDRLAAVSDGRVFTAPEARELGLIDTIQPFGETIGALRIAASPSRQTSIARARTTARMMDMTCGNLSENAK